METYPKYKHSGIDWIGDIPEHWKVKKIKYLIRKRITDGPHETPVFQLDGIPFLSVDSIQNGELTFENCRYISKDNHDKYQNKCIVEKNDILMGKAASIGKIAQVKVDFEFSIWSPLALIKIKKDILNSTFFENYLKTPISQYQIEILCTSNTQKNISMEEIPLIECVIPPLPEQTAIADFLDKKTAMIDSFIEKKKKLVELLKEERTAIINQAVTKGLNQNLQNSRINRIKNSKKNNTSYLENTANPENPDSDNVKLKPSGIEWLGDIPEHWELKKLKYVAVVQSSNVDKKTIEGEEPVLLCNYIDVYKNEFIEDSIQFMQATAKDSQIQKFILHIGDVLITKDSETPDDIAKPAYVIKDFDNVICGYHLAQIKANQVDLFGEYLFRLFQSKDFNTNFEISAHGITRYGLPLDSITDVIIPLPAITEQNEIVKYIRTQTQKIDTAIEKIEKETELMQKYRTALINEVVTGKVKVV